MLKKSRWLLASIAAVLAIGGCTDQAKQDYSAAGTDAANAAKETGKAISEDASKAGASFKSGADKAGQSLSAAAAGAKKALSNDETSASVQQALLAAKDLKTTNLKVDTTGTLVTLHGSVPTDDQKRRAEEIAKGVLGSTYTLDDQLKVNG